MNSFEKIESVWKDPETPYAKFKGSRVDFLRKMLCYREGDTCGNVALILTRAKADIDLSVDAWLARYNDLKFILERADNRLSQLVEDGDEIVNLNDFIYASDSSIEAETNNLDISQFDVFTLEEYCTMQSMVRNKVLTPCRLHVSSGESLNLNPCPADMLVFQTESEVISFVSKMNATMYESSSFLEQYALYVLLTLIKVGACKLPMAIIDGQYRSLVTESFDKVTEKTAMLNGKRFVSLHKEELQLPQIKNTNNYDVDTFLGTVHCTFINR